jgi:hypothetical protein
MKTVKWCPSPWTLHAKDCMARATIITLPAGTSAQVCHPYNILQRIVQHILQNLPCWNQLSHNCVKCICTQICSRTGAIPPGSAYEGPLKINMHHIKRWTPAKAGVLRFCTVSHVHGTHNIKVRMRARTRLNNHGLIYNEHMRFYHLSFHKTKSHVVRQSLVGLACSVCLSGAVMHHLIICPLPAHSCA